MVDLLRCVGGLLKRCASGELRRCPNLRQWQARYVNDTTDPCGTCVDGVYPGRWSSSEIFIATGDDVRPEYAGMVVIDADAGAATSYGEVFGGAYQTGELPPVPDAQEPGTTHDPCSCTARWYVLCHCAYACSGVNCGALLAAPQPSTVVRSTDDITIGAAGCLDVSSPCVPSVDVRYANARSEKVNFCACGGPLCLTSAVVAGPFCSQAEADAYDADNCGTGAGTCCDPTLCN